MLGQHFDTLRTNLLFCCLALHILCCGFESLGEFCTMSSLPSTNVAPVMQMREGDWRALLSSIRSGNLIPMVGPDLMRVKVGDKMVTYDHLLAEELASQRGISDQDLAQMGTSLEE